MFSKALVNFVILLRIHKIAESDYTLLMSVRPSVCLSIHPSVRMEQLEYHLSDFVQI
jgi:hypothetical protein